MKEFVHAKRAFLFSIVPSSRDVSNFSGTPKRSVKALNLIQEMIFLRSVHFPPSRAVIAGSSELFRNAEAIDTARNLIQEMLVLTQAITICNGTPHETAATMNFTSPPPLTNETGDSL